MHGRKSHRIVERGIEALCNLEHRGAAGAEVNTGDGAGILIQMPDGFLRATVNFELPPLGAYATGIGFLPQDPAEAENAQLAIEKVVIDEGLTVLGWRDVPVVDDMLGKGAAYVEPTFRQLFVGSDGNQYTDMDLERRAFILRKRIEHEVGGSADASGDTSVYFPSFSCRTLIYKGMLTVPQLPEFFPDLTDERMESALALVHS